jgi:hypothetical protein
MSIRHAALLALMGWYLIMPPLGSGVVPPISQWRRAGVFEKADDCTTAQNLILSACRQDLDDMKRRRMAERRRGIVTSEAEESVRSTFHTCTTTLLSRCVASDDPGLAGGASSEPGRPPGGRPPGGSR